MAEIIKKYKYQYPNLDLEIVDVSYVGDVRFANRVMYNFRYMGYDEQVGLFYQIIGIDNSHGKPHIHLKDRKEEVDYDWKQANAQFDKLVEEHRRSRRL